MKIIKNQKELRSVKMKENPEIVTEKKKVI